LGQFINRHIVQLIQKNLAEACVFENFIEIK